MDYWMIMIIIVTGAGIAIVYMISQVKVFRNLTLSEAAELFAKGDLFRAKSALERILEEDPNNSLALWYAARLDLQMNEQATALEKLEKIATLNRYDLPEQQLEALENFSELETRKLIRSILLNSRNEEALFRVNQILMNLDPKNAEYPLALAQALVRKQEYSARSLGFVKATLDIDPGNIEALMLGAVIYLRQDAFEQAEKLASAILEKNPNIVDARYVLGEVRFQQNRDSEAREKLLSAQNSPFYGKSVAFALGKLSMRAQNQEEALDFLKKADLHPRSSRESEDLDWSVKYQMARLHETRNEKTQAVQIYEIIRKFRPGFRDTEDRLSLLLQHHKVEKTDHLKDFITAKHEQFQKICERIAEKLGLKPVKSFLTGDGNVNIIALNHDIKPQQVCLFFRRNYDVLQEDQPRLLEKFTENSKAAQSVLITSGSFSENARKFCDERKIRMIGGDTLNQYLTGLF